MSDDIGPVSAFSVYAAKRKNTEQLSNCKNKKGKHLLQEASNKRRVKQQDVKQINQQIKSTSAWNIAMKNKDDIDNTKKSNLKTYKCSSLFAARKIKSTQKLNSVNRVQQLNKVNNIQDIHKELKLKGTKKKNKNNNRKKAIKTILPKNVEKKDNSADNIKLCQMISNATNDPVGFSQLSFEWLIHPLKVKDFFRQNWEKTPLHTKRNMPNYYKCLMSTPLLDNVLRENHILFTKNIDITSYSNGVRETHNPSGRALSSVVWDYYMNGCSVRMLNPQTFIPQLHSLNATLQEFFGCFVGANSYLTPPNSQGFAPHYDDIEAFILQVEGKKRWRLYMPPNENEYLARYSSKNFDQSEIGEPILDTIVNAGDLLYLPRGTIHQGTTIDDTHSLHVTLSVYQKNSWCDLLEMLLPQTLQRAAETDSRFRKGLPPGYLKHTGVVYGENYLKQQFKSELIHLFNQLVSYIDVDSVVDLMAKRHIHDFLPPFLTKDERRCSVAEDGKIMTTNGVVRNHAEITSETKIRLLRLHCIRLIKEDDTYRIYYSTENSKEYHEYEPQFLEIDKEFVPAVREIIISYPKFVLVKELPIEDDDNKIQVVKDLWEIGLVITDVPLCSTN